MTELHDGVMRACADDEVGCIVITGAGTRAFSAGGDIHEQREDDRQRAQADLDERAALRARASYEISACPKPTIGMINGLAYGGAAGAAPPPRHRVGRGPARVPLPGPAHGRRHKTRALAHHAG